MLVPYPKAGNGFPQVDPAVVYRFAGYASLQTECFEARKRPISSSEEIPPEAIRPMPGMPVSISFMASMLGPDSIPSVAISVYMNSRMPSHSISRDHIHGIHATRPFSSHGSPPWNFSRQCPRPGYPGTGRLWTSERFIEHDRARR